MLVTVGDAENVEHDWFYMFSKLGLLQHDTAIAAVVRILGWMGMLSTVAWMWWRSNHIAKQTVSSEFEG